MNIQEGACLQPVAPHLNGRIRGNHLAAERSRRLLAATLPGTLWTVYVVEAGDPRLHPKVLGVVHVQLLGHELLQPVRVLYKQAGRGVIAMSTQYKCKEVAKPIKNSTISR